MIQTVCLICGLEHEDIMSPVCEKCTEAHRQGVLGAISTAVKFSKRKVGFTKLKAALSLFTERED